MEARSSSVVTRVMRKQEESGGALVVAMPQAKSKKMDSKHGEEVATPPHPIASLVRSGVLMPPRSSVSPSPSVLHAAVHVPPPFLHPNPRAACRLSQLLTRSSALGDGSTAVPTLSHSQWPAGCGVVTAMWLWCGDCDVAVVWWLLPCACAGGGWSQPQDAQRERWCRRAGKARNRRRGHGGCRLWSDYSRHV